MGLGAASAAQNVSPLAVPPWMKVPGKSFSEYGTPSPHASGVKRSILKIYGDVAPGTGVSFTPLHDLEGTVTPNGLHFERHHNGVPQIDPAQHKLLVHGLVKRQLLFSLNDLLRYPMTTRTCFSRFERAPEEMRRRYSPETYSGCTTVTRRPNGGA